jgi:hypothetical protein
MPKALGLENMATENTVCKPFPFEETVLEGDRYNAR